MNERRGWKDIERQLRELLLASGYAEKAIDYFLRRPYMGTMRNPDHKTELTGPCGDIMRCYLKIDRGRIRRAKYEVIGCSGAISAAMALADLVKGKTLKDALKVRDGDVFRELVEIPDQKQHCIRLAVKTMEKAIRGYQRESKKTSRKMEKKRALV